MSGPAAEMSGALDWIAVDWGTSRLRAWAMSRDGAALGGVSGDLGMGKLAPEGFAPALQALAAPWLEGRAEPVRAVICGMAGAREGWAEAPYRPAPCAPVGGGFVKAPGGGRIEAWIAPGLSQLDPPDVMRGEETQIAGLLAARPDFDGAVCLPGTHSKWAHVRGGRVLRFQTFLTGELFALLSESSVLRHCVGTGETPAAAFDAAARGALEAPETAMGRLFALRARRLLLDAPLEEGRGGLSGLLIGAEISAAARFWRGGEVAIAAEPPLAALYARALVLAGAAAPVCVASDEATRAGLVQAARMLDAGERRGGGA